MADLRQVDGVAHCDQCVHDAGLGTVEGLRPGESVFLLIGGVRTAGTVADDLGPLGQLIVRDCGGDDHELAPATVVKRTTSETLIYV